MRGKVASDRPILRIRSYSSVDSGATASRGPATERADALNGAIHDVNDFLRQFRTTVLAQPTSRLVGFEPRRIAAFFLGRHQTFDLAQMGLHRHHHARRAEALALGMEVPVKRLELDAAFDARFLEGLSRSCVGMGSIVANATFGKSPASAAGANQEELRFVALQPIANRCYVNTFACEYIVDIQRPI